MRSALRFALATTLAAGLAPAALAGAAEVSFVAPETYTDAALHRGAVKERTRNLDELARHIARLAERLPAGHTLKVEVTDVDLAGRYEPRTAPYDIRIMRTITPPRIALRYTLTDGGGTVRSDEAALRDLAYLDKAAFVATQDALRYEKRLLSDWFRKTFERNAS